MVTDHTAHPPGPIPPNRWEQAAANEKGYGRKFAQLVTEGADSHGEARVADVLVGRGSTILDAGAGMGRVGARLADLGHDVTAVEKDPALIAMAADFYPDLPMIESDILGVTPELLRAHGRPTAYDLVVVVGNVMILLAPDTERWALSMLAQVTRPGGRILFGFHPVGGGPTHGRHYPPAEFIADAESVGLQVEHHFGGYNLEPVGPDYAVFVARRPTSFEVLT